MNESPYLRMLKNKIILLDPYYLHESKVLRAIKDNLMVFEAEPRME